MEITSPAFAHATFIPSLYTCDGKNLSPELAWTNPPEGTESFVLIVDDPDAPVGNWDHWILFNIPADARGLPEGGTLGISGNNSWGKTGYGGPCPPSGTHRYFFKLYALNTTLSLPESAKKPEVLAAMEGHILAKTELMGRYARP